MRYLLLTFLLIPALSYGQDNANYKSDTIKRGTVKSKFIVSLNAGLNYPGRDYGNNPANFTIINYEEPLGYAYGYSSEGFHTDLSGIYMLSHHIGLEGRFGMDVSSVSSYDVHYNFKLHDPINRVYQYLIGMHVFVFPSESRFNLSFIGLIGLTSVDINISNNFSEASFSYRSDDIIPGNGTGFAYYGGVEVRVKVYKKIHFSFSLGYFGSRIYFPNSADTQINYSYWPMPNGTTTVSTFNTVTKMNLSITQANFGISYHL